MSKRCLASSSLCSRAKSSLSASTLYLYRNSIPRMFESFVFFRSGFASDYSLRIRIFASISSLRWSADLRGLPRPYTFLAVDLLGILSMLNCSVTFIEAAILFSSVLTSERRGVVIWDPAEYWFMLRCGVLKHCPRRSSLND